MLKFDQFDRPVRTIYWVSCSQSISDLFQVQNLFTVKISFKSIHSVSS